MTTEAPTNRQRARRILGSSLLTLVAVVVVACGPSDSTSNDSGTSLAGSLTVSAAASLQGAFTDIEVAFEKAHPRLNVTVNFGASPTLAQQIIDAAPVDVFASADEATMEKVADEKLLNGAPTIFATNSLEIIVRKGNPSKITSLTDLSTSRLLYVTCAPEVPIGKYAGQVLQKAALTVRPASFEPDVKGIVAKVASGEADAGIVYATDINATKGAAEGVVIPPNANITAEYPIARISTSANSAAAQAWIAFVTSNEGRAILRGYGFGTP